MFVLLEATFMCHRRHRSHSQDIVDKPTSFEKGSALQSMTEEKRSPVLRKYFDEITCVCTAVMF